MCDITEFLEKYPRSRKAKPFSARELSLLSDDKAPPVIAQFLQTEGQCAYHDDFFLTTLPRAHFQTLSEWGLNGKQCFAFMRTALGSICYSHNGKIYQLDPISGYLYKGRFDFCDFMNVLATMDSFLESAYFDVYKTSKTNQILEYDDVYGLFPALPLGGSFQSSHFKIVKMREYLAISAQLYAGKARQL